VVHRPTGPYPDSQFEHSSVAATVKKIFGLDQFLTARDAWAGTFEDVFSQRTTPRDDCPGTCSPSPLDKCYGFLEFQAKTGKDFHYYFSILLYKEAVKIYPHKGGFLSYHLAFGDSPCLWRRHI
jgi:hypothetical protein